MVCPAGARALPVGVTARTGRVYLARALRRRRWWRVARPVCEGDGDCQEDIKSVVTVDVLTRPSVRGVATTEIAVMGCSAATTAAYHSLLQGRCREAADCEVGQVCRRGQCQEGGGEGQRCRDDRQCANGFSCERGQCRPTPTRTRSAATTVNATRASAASMAVAFETVVVATQVSAETTTTVVMNNCVTIRAAARLATTTNPAPRASVAKALGLGARSVWMADYRLF